jgi:hypothetical protein
VFHLIPTSCSPWVLENYGYLDDSAIDKLKEPGEGMVCVMLVRDTTRRKPLRSC